MNSIEQSPRRTGIGPYILIAAIVGIVAAAFAYTAGWLSPNRLTPAKIVSTFAGPGGPALGHRRNHAKGICFTGVFEANGAGSIVSSAPMFLQGEYPVIGRFNIASPDLKVQDATARVRGMGLQIGAPDGQVWRMAMIDAPFFPVGTPQVFYTFLTLSGSKDPDAMKQFAAAHPSLAAFGAWAQGAPWTASYAEDQFNSLNSFAFTNAAGASSIVRWSLVPAATPATVAPEELAKRGPDFLEEEIVQRVKAGPVQWSLVVTIANPGDPTADPSKEWPHGRRSLTVGSLVVREIEAERDGPCRDINYDPTVLPKGMTTSDDPFPAARSSAYRRSYDLRTSEEHFYPRTASENAP
jgi:catalase